ncbi:hypothetical protein BDW62DRAFT_206811 [Aspergillus aurantiobrunneus]
MHFENEEQEKRFKILRYFMGELAIGPSKAADGNYYVKPGRTVEAMYFRRWIAVSEIPGSGEGTFRHATMKDMFELAMESENDTPAPKCGEHARGFLATSMGGPIMVGTGDVIEGGVRDNSVVCIVEELDEERLTDTGSEEASEEVIVVTYEEEFAEELKEAADNAKVQLEKSKS